MATLEPDRNQIETFGEALFRYASPTSFVSVRSFLDGAKNQVFSIKAISLNQGLGKLFDLVEDEARRAANAAKKVVFCPPIATFTNAKKAGKLDVADGLTLSTELDKNPDDALAKLEAILGPATCVVKSGGQWIDENGRPVDKLHGHWRLRIPARGEVELAKLERARELAADLVGGDPSHTPISHPIRWPGSWHRKGEPRLCTARTDQSREIDLQTALAALEAASIAEGRTSRAKPNGKDQTAGGQQYSSPDWQKLIANILTAEKFHDAIIRLAMKLLRSGMHDGAAVNLIRGWMEAAAPEQSQRDERWQARYDDVPRAVSTARAKVGENKQDADNKGDELPELFINETNLPATAKELARLIAGLRDFVFNGTIPARIAIDDDCMPRAVETAPESVCVHGHEVCRPMRLKREKGRPKKAEVKMAEPAQKLVPCTLPMSVARLYLYGLHGQWGLKTLHGITTAPILEDNGNIRIAEGFDDNTGLYCYKIPAVTVPSNPTKDEATAALYRLRYFFRTFPYTDAERLLDPDLGVEIVDLRKAPGMDESTFLVAVMTAVCRQSLVLTPGYLVRAAAMSGAGTGKGLLVAAICILSSGAAPTAFTAGHDKEEFDKRLSSALIEQRPCVFLDNYNNAELHSAILASALTQSPAMVRRMGQSSMTPLYTRTFIVVTGNGVTVAEDQVRRWLITEFDARTENPENRKFDPGFLDTVRGARTDLLTDALTIWRWGRQNNIAQGKPLGSYEVWSQWCRDPILALGGRDPVDRNAETKAADPLRQRMIDIFEAWWAHHGDILIKANDLHADVLGLIDFKAKSNDIGELTVNRQWVAGYLRSKIGARVGGFLLSQVKDTSRTRPVAFYKLQQTKEPIP